MKKSDKRDLGSGADQESSPTRSCGCETFWFHSRRRLSRPACRSCVMLSNITRPTTGEFDYDDLITGVARALDGPRGDELVRAMRDRYRFALIDEFQDTDELQWKFLRRVFIESEGRNIAYLIADPKQAIYGFRGADVATYIEARDEVEQAGTPRVPLIENFRSTPLHDRGIQSYS